MKRFLYLVTILSSLALHPLVAQSPVVSSGLSTARLEHLDAYVENEIDQDRIPGAVVLIHRNGETVYHKAYGYRNLEEQEPMEAEDIFYIQSMTKPIISVAFMMLYEGGHFLLTDPVSKYLPAFKDLAVIRDPEEGIKGETVPLKQDITIAHLLTHTAGLTHGLDGSRFDRELMQKAMGINFSSIGDRVDSILTIPLRNQPGAEWRYSFAPDVLSVLIEQFSGMSTAEFLKERIFEPLEMKDTAYNLSPEQQERVVRLHGVYDDSGLTVSKRYQPPMSGNTVWSGVNALFSTPSDYLHFCQMLLNQGVWKGRRLLSRKTVELMTINQTGDLFPAPGYGFGYGFRVLTNLGETQLYGSEGLFNWGGAYNTHFFIDPEEDLIAIFCTQTEPYSDFYHEKLRQLTYQALVD
jgi:CubicO group peptidase (beta-lactamase class C family)